jgi:DNA (cytosine-5)-methyltransferase 1
MTDFKTIPEKFDRSTAPAALRYGSVCSGIEAASVAWEPLGWKASFLSEIDRFPRAVLSHHYPKVPLHGDFTSIQAGDYDPIDLLVGGTPCQSFSVAGLRGGLADDRGNLALEYLKLAQRLRPKWLVWENVPGVLSSAGGRDFGAVLGGLVELGYGFAYRVLDAQFFGVPQRRRRVFVVGYLGDWRRAAAVLFERHSLQGHSPPRRETGQRAAPTISARTEGGGGLGTGFDLDGGVIEWPPQVAPSLYAKFGNKMGLENQHLDSLKGGLFTFAIQERAVSENLENGPQGKGYQPDAAYTLEARNKVQAVAFTQNQRDEIRELTVAGALSAEPGMKQQTYVQTSAVRRLTPRECERLQGFPDDYTLISHRGKPAADGPRYKALGNSMAVPVMRWIGERIATVEARQQVRAA